MEEAFKEMLSKDWGWMLAFVVLISLPWIGTALILFFLYRNIEGLFFWHDVPSSYQIIGIENAILQGIGCLLWNGFIIYLMYG